MSSEAEVQVVLVNKRGLHARAAAKFVKVASAFGARVMVSKIAGVGVAQGADVKESSGASIMGLLMLGAECGATLRLCATGDKAQAAVAELKKLVEERFGEE